MNPLPVAGVDGCPGGWVAVIDAGNHLPLRAVAAVTFEDLLRELEEASVLGVDIPIGLPDRGARSADLAAREILGPGRASSVFPAPCRPLLAARDYPEACALAKAASPEGKAISQQAFNLLPRIRQVDDFMTPRRQERVREIHPELCFVALNGGQALRYPKKIKEGREERKRLLEAAGLAADALSRPRVPGGKVAPLVDVLDAAAACWTARRLAEGRAERVPLGEPPLDSRGLRMEMWY